MNLQYQKARELMVENQLRPNKINDPQILELFKKIKKEDFLPNDKKKISYYDSEISLYKNRGYLKNLHLAQLIFFADITNYSKVLHIGGLTGYVSVMLANICKKLIVIENQKNLLLELEKNIARLKIYNTEVINSKFILGCPQDSPYDVIFIDNPISELSDTIKEQLSPHSGKIIMIKKSKDYLCKALKFTKIEKKLTSEYLFDVFSKYELYKLKENFVF